jgi:hypothetical protein
MSPKNYLKKVIQQKKFNKKEKTIFLNYENSFS